MRIFFDTSAFVKRYINEKGTEAVIKHCREAQEIIISIICIPEIISALNRLLRENQLHPDEYKKLKDQMFEDSGQLTLVNINANVIEHSIRCLEKGKLRAMDGIHIASAIESGCDIFISSDKNQCASARHFNLLVEEI